MGGGDSSPTGQRWVVVTGLVPYEEQIESYQEAYSKVEDYSPEFDGAPDYVYYYVERAEVLDGQPADEPEWRLMPRPKETQWATTRSEVADLMYVTDKNARLVGALGPWVNGQWDEDVAHPPEIPLASREGEPDSGRQPEEIRGRGRPDFGDPDGRFGEGGGGWSGADAHAMEVGEEGPENPEYLLFRFFDFTVQPGKQYVYRTRLMVWNPSARKDVKDRYLDEHLLDLKKKSPAEYEKLKAEHKKLREEYKKPWGEYKKLQAKYEKLKGQENKQLAEDLAAKREETVAKYKEVLAKGREAAAAKVQWTHMLSNWSEPTEPVTVPRNERLLAVSVTQPNRKTSPPTAKVMVIKWLEKDGTEAYEEFPQLARGKVANFPNCHFPEISDIRRAERLEDLDEPTPRPRRPRAGEEEEEDETTRVDYMSETIILDMWGGQRIPGRDRGMKSPGRILMLDPDGRLLVRHEIDDLEEYEKRTVDEEGVIEGGLEGQEFEGTDGFMDHFE